MELHTHPKTHRVRWMHAAPTMALVGLIATTPLTGCGEPTQTVVTRAAAPTACAQVTCSGHGMCAVVDDNPTCACDAGYRPEGLNCLPIDPASPTLTDDTTSTPTRSPTGCDALDCGPNGDCFYPDGVGGRADCLCDHGHHAEFGRCVPNAVDDPCEGVTCSRRGDCVVYGSVPTCDCAPGYVHQDLHCVPYDEARTEFDGDAEPPNTNPASGSRDATCDNGAPDYADAPETPTAVKLRVYIEQHPGEDPVMTLSEVDADIARTNRFFAPTGIQFFVDSTPEIIDPVDHDSPSGNTPVGKTALYLVYVRNDSMEACGYASIPPVLRPSAYVRADCALGTTTAHELGHALGLEHPHGIRNQSGYTLDDIAAEVEPIDSDCYGTSEPIGDGLCDTPPDPGPKFCTLNRSCEATCAAPAGWDDDTLPNGSALSAYAPDAFLVMGYYKACRDSERAFSAEQAQLMRCILGTSYAPMTRDPHAPRVSGVSPLEAVLNEPQVFEVQGENLNGDVAFWVDNCHNAERVGAVDPQRLYFRCTPRDVIGEMAGRVAPEAGSDVTLKSFQVQVRDDEASVCDGDAIAPCGRCMSGTQTRTCTPDGWSDWSPCHEERGCLPGETLACEDNPNDVMVCDDACVWDATACDAIPQLACTGPAERACGMCGTQSRVCDTATGQYSAWSACTDEGVCAPNTTRTCGSGGSDTCTASCAWSGQCTGQTCTGPDTEACGACGTRTRTCSNGLWSDWSACTGQGACTPGATQSCGANSSGTQTCSDTCGWSTCALPSPIVTSVSPRTATEHHATTFTVYGSNMPDTLAMWIHTCDDMEQLSHTPTQVRFRCTPRYGTGQRELVVKDRPGGDTLHTDTITVTPDPNACPSPTVTSVSPTSATLNQPTTFTAEGCGLLSSTAMWIHQCDGLTQTSHTPNRVTFRCTPRWDRGTKDAVVKDRPGGATLRSFTVSVH